MLKYRLSSFLFASILGLTACGGDNDRTSSDSAPINQTFVVFSPATGALPVPSDLQFSSEPAQDGTMNAGIDPTNPVITGIDFLDGSSVLAPFDIAFTDSLNTAQSTEAANFVESGGSIVPNPNQNVFLLPLTYPSGDGLSQASIDDSSVEVPTFAEALTYQTAVATADVTTLSELAMPKVRAEIISLDNGTNNVLRINPLQPLLPKTKYLVVVTTLEDSRGNPVLASSPYSLIRDSNNDLSKFGEGTAASLGALRVAIQGWERLAAGYFGFMQTVFDSASVGASAPSANDIIFTMTFTTGGTTDTLEYISAPEAFFEDSLSSGYKKASIVNLVTGFYDLSGIPSVNNPSNEDLAINGLINTLLTQPLLPGDIPNALYNESIANAINNGADYATIAADASAAYIMQRAAAEAAISVHEGDGISIAAEAIGTVQALTQGAPASALFPVPLSRPTNFYRVDPANTLNPQLAAPAQVYQGDITLPYYQGRPTEMDLAPVVTSSWIADATIGGAIDIGRGNPAGTTPPSDKVTYRYPFPTKQSDVTIPVVVTTPDEAALATVDVTRPEAGWPVIIFVHGITGERSFSLPMANALASACVALDGEGMPSAAIPGVPCFATVAIDQPLHGVAPAEGPGGMEGSKVPGLRSVSDPGFIIEPNIGTNTPTEGLTERHFDTTAGADGATPIAMNYDAEVGNSGSLFINLTNFANARDNLRQMSIDLLNLNASIDDMDLNGDGTADELDTDNVYLVNHSLGAINGFPFLAINNSTAVQDSIFSDQPRVKAATGMLSGGGITRLLTNSVSFSPTILQGLAAASTELVQGKRGLETYLNVFQGILDSADVMNFANSLSDANASTGILLTEAIGGNGVLPDQTIPNAADDIWGTPPLNLITDTGFVINGFPAPLAGTEPMIAQFGAIKTADVPDESDGDGEVIVTRFTEGTHGTPITADNVDVFTELVSQIVAFFIQDGIVTESIISNTDVVED